MDSQGTLSQILEKEEQSWMPHTSWFQDILQSFRNQNMVVLKQKRHSANGIDRKQQAGIYDLWQGC